ncbi:aminoacyl-tRNA deacylase [Defluviimonas sp. SAOS-178_SWC]|uniref:aminoacyl-tRNA deacylase n=1 Tax=Defluviimonas sp. SAOS-178_SWC TaxID=3121287 RepID=UPI0032216E7C
MSIAKRLKTQLDAQGIAFETTRHPRTATSAETAEVAHIPGNNFAKAVLVHLDDDFSLAVVPSTHRVDLSALQNVIDRRIGLASESDIARLFFDCDTGALPPVGAAYDVPCVVDEALSGLERVWFEGGDHRTLVSVSGGDFDTLMQSATHGQISNHA